MLQECLAGIVGAAQLLFAEHLVQVAVARTAHIYASVGHLFPGEILFEPLVAVVFSGDEVVKGERSVATTQGTAGFVGFHDQQK